MTIFNKKLAYIEDQYGLSISFRWFTPAALFMLFFCIAWDSFLIFWYGIGLSMGGPWIMFVFPIIHVMVGVSMTYYTLCSLFNRTYIDVTDGHLDVRHAPIPWWRGNVHLPTGEIEQIYVKEIIEKNNNSNSRSYGLNAKMVDGTDEQLLTVGGLDAQQAKELEHRIESYIGIIDRPVVGEYNSGTLLNTKNVQPAARRQRKTSFNGPLGFLFTTKPGEYVYYQEQEQKVNHITQLDWNNGDSDKSLQFLDHDQKEKLIYIKKNRGLTDAFRETKIPLYEANAITFQTASPPASFTYQGALYFLDTHSTGKAYLSDISQPVDTDQWIYTQKGNIAQVRIVNQQNQMTFFKGEKAAESHFYKEDERLDLREIDLDYNRQEEDEGFV